MRCRAWTLVPRVSGFALLAGMQVQAAARLEGRTRCTAADYNAATAAVEAAYGAAPYQPTGSIGDLQPGTAYLAGIDERHRRTYAWTSWS